MQTVVDDLPAARDDCGTRLRLDASRCRGKPGGFPT
jgi:hypothetical protein